MYDQLRLIFEDINCNIGVTMMVPYVIPPPPPKKPKKTIHCSQTVHTSTTTFFVDFHLPPLNTLPPTD